MSKDYELDNEDYKGIEESIRQQPMMNQAPFKLACIIWGLIKLA